MASHPWRRWWLPAGYEELYRLVQRVMQWADQSYDYTMVAVTKNFVGSPHIDANDTSFQFAVSLGDFTEGGELCVENEQNPGSVYVVNTHNKLAKVDGRYIHWVRRFRGGDRCVMPLSLPCISAVLIRVSVL